MHPFGPQHRSQVAFDKISSIYVTKIYTLGGLYFYATKLKIYLTSLIKINELAQLANQNKYDAFS